MRGLVALLSFFLRIFCYPWSTVTADSPKCPDGWQCGFYGVDKWQFVSNMSGTEDVVVDYDGRTVLTAKILMVDCRARDTVANFTADFLHNLSIPHSHNMVYRVKNCQFLQNFTLAELFNGHKITKLRYSPRLQEDGKPSTDSPDPVLFRNLHELLSLSLEGCLFSALTPSLFDGMPNLQNLTLRENLLTEIPSQLFSSVSALRMLDVSNNLLKSFTDPVKNLGNLSRLFLYNNKINQITREFMDSVPSLQILDLQGNQLRNLSADLFRSTRLKSLKLFSNRLESIPDDLLGFQTELETLDLSDNANLTVLPDNLLANQSSLVSLRLKRCNLLRIPKDLFRDKPLLDDLNLGGNKLSELDPSVFQHVPKLQTLDMSFNQIRNIPKDVYKRLRTLQTLTLRGNLLESIDDVRTFKDLRELQTLDLSRNKLSFIARETLEENAKLVKLDLSKNRLNYSEIRDWFSLPDSINDINLSENRIQTIPSKWLIQYTQMKHLDMSHNEVSIFDYSNCQPTSEDVRIDLTFNRITSVLMDLKEAELREEFGGVGPPPSERPKVILGFNPIVCDCNIYDLLRYYRYQSSRRYLFTVDIQNLVCHDVPQPNPSKNTVRNSRIEAFPPVGSVLLVNRSVSSLKVNELVCITDAEHCPRLCQCRKYVEKSLTVVDCSGRELIKPPTAIPLGTNALLLDHNNIKTLDGFADGNGEGWNNLTHLSLTDNFIDTLRNFKVLPKSLIEINLAGNDLQNIPDEVLQEVDEWNPQLRILLQDNPWACNCSAMPLKKWMISNVQRLENVTNVRCSNSSYSYRDDYGIPVTLATICPEEEMADPKKMLIGVTIISLILAVGLATVGIGYYRYQREIKIWLYSRGWCLWFVTENEIDREKTYDAFISFSHEDAEFVAYQLLPGLESPLPDSGFSDSGYKVCIHYRDWLAGEWIPDSIVRSVKDSRRTIVVLTKNFIRSVWGRWEFKAAHHQALEDRTNRIIIIVHGDLPPSSEMDPELKMYVKFNTYLNWDDPWFWQRLRYAMPHRRPEKLPFRLFGRQFSSSSASSMNPITNSMCPSPVSEEPPSRIPKNSAVRNGKNGALLPQSVQPSTALLEDKMELVNI